MTSKRVIEQRKNIIKDVVKQLNTKRLIASARKAVVWSVKIQDKWDEEHDSYEGRSDFLLREICKKLLRNPECLFRAR